MLPKNLKPRVFFSYLYNDYLANAFVKDSKSKRRFTQLLSRMIIRTRWLSTRHFERNWIFTKTALSFQMLSKWARHPLLNLSLTRPRQRGWSFSFKSQRMNASIQMRRSSQEILLRPKGGLRSRLRPHLISPSHSFCFFFGFNTTLNIECLLKYDLVYSVLPEHCEVNDPNLQDSFLAKLGFYTDLPPLP